MTTAAALSFNNLTTMTVSIEHHIAHIQLSRPDKLNSMVPAFWQELPSVVRSIDEHSAARVIVISAQGKHFSAGMDLSVFENMAKDFSGEPARRAERLRRMVFELQDSFNALETVRMPVLAAVHGGAIGGAVDMLSACCSRYCTQEAFFCIKETQIGMTADLGTLQRLPHIMPHGLVRELAYTGRNLSADEALRCGFVNQVFSDPIALLEGVMSIAKAIAANSPMAVHGCKDMITYARDHSVADSLNHMATWQAGMFQMPDVHTAIQAQKERKPPQFDELHTRFSRL
ncbi:crotonase/enoyl-CoA hydratase family protein [Alteromonas oceanisediminis]|uniref:crotonase/enoyl-CoA hydratase family protein n=1 Tax=Alteromonas oceanisediminis TaxID=2836180 RepID=UPI001BD93EF9|nr:crotonase/enoyl-CoA hydratase family protein [Alteromonas oceanisediminis]MBT0587442.1 crotonase/enoyl-CoA hydratase family protein [Alteromonas oceanisediminis]